MTEEELTDRLNREILVLDGAMGTMLMQALASQYQWGRGACEQGPCACYDELVLTNPGLIRDIHAAYLEAGADIITTNTFNANRISLADYKIGDRVKDICLKGAELAREAVNDCCLKNGIPTEKRPIVAGGMGPTVVSLSKCQDACYFERMADAYAEQASALIEGGVDILLLETVFDMRNAEAAMVGIEKSFAEQGRRLPLIISMTVNENGRLYSGQTIEEFVDIFSASDVIAFGLNCGSAREMLSHVERLAKVYHGFIAAYPNAGMPDEHGIYNETPDLMVNTLRPLLEKRLINIVGGCCGTTPEYIRLIADTVKKLR